MSRSVIITTVTAGTVGLLAAWIPAAVSVTIEAYTTGAIGTAGSGLNTAAYTSTADSKIQDFPRNTGGGTNKFARGLSNNNWASSTILPVGPGGGVTLKFQEPVFALADAKEFAIHNGTFLSSSGGFFYGDMEGSILVSNDNAEWRTLNGQVVADPLTYAGTIYNMNAPTMSYDWGTGKVAWDYCTGSGKPQSVLDTFELTDYLSPMPDDTIFNDPASTNGQRAALKNSTDPNDYSSVFGGTAGGNWFDISDSGLSQIQYLRINVAANAPAIVRLDSVFANAMAVPEPSVAVTLALGSMLLLGRWRRRIGAKCVPACAMAGAVAVTSIASASPYANFDFDDIDYWVGSGSNQAALVIDFASPAGSSSYAWGYRWDGIATGEDMFTAIAGTTIIRGRDGGSLVDTLAGHDSRLYLRSSAFGGSLGNSVFGIGYDADGDGGAFTSGSEGDETGFASDPDDHYREGWFDGYWSYWLAEADTTAWGYSGFGFSNRVLANDSWDGWSFQTFVPEYSGGEPGIPVAASVPEPGTLAAIGAASLLALRRRRRHVVATAVGVAGAASLSPVAQADSPYATSIVSQTTAFGGNSLYNDPNAVLGEPTRIAKNTQFTNGGSNFHVKIVEPAYNVDLGGNKVITTISRTGSSPNYTYGSITVKFDQPIYDNPANPYGIDLNVFGNTFYVGGGTSGGFVSDTTDMRSYYLAGGAFGEPVVVSVSPDNVNWYTYSSGPFGDTAFPTQGYEWSASQHDLTGNGWTETKTDFAKPVNPTLGSVLGTTNSASPYYRASTADAIGAYVNSGGGTGFDLAVSGFESIQYVRVEANATYRDGEIDGFAAVRPMSVGEALSITPDNVAAGTSLFFQSEADATRTAILADFTNVSDLAKLSTAALTDVDLLSAITDGTVLAAYELEVTKLIGAGGIAFAADLSLLPGLSYAGDGSDLSVLSWDGLAWQPLAFTFDAGSGLAQVEGWSDASGYLAISQVPEPAVVGVLAAGVAVLMRRARRAA